MICIAMSFVASTLGIFLDFRFFYESLISADICSHLLLVLIVFHNIVQIVLSYLCFSVYATWIVTNECYEINKYCV
jgi:hypothetical protein